MVDHLFFIEAGAAGASYLLVDEVLTVWQKEERPDRISTAADLAKSRTTVTLFKQVAGPFVPPHVLVAVEARFLSGRVGPASPAEVHPPAAPGMAGWRAERQSSDEIILPQRAAGAAIRLRPALTRSVSFARGQ
jgi:hypothetical protein